LETYKSLGEGGPRTGNPAVEHIFISPIHNGAPIAMTDYESLLKRARKDLPDVISDHSRFTIPTAEIIYEGKTTVLRNFTDIATTLHRDTSHLLAYLLRELGTAGSQEGRRVIFKGRVMERKIQDRIEDYTKTFVLCSECNRPDTHLEKDGKTLTLRCEACGGHRPVKVSKQSTSQSGSARPSEGDVIEVQITSVGKRGDGMARMGDYIVFVKGASRGTTVKVKIDRVVGKVIQASVA